MPATIRQWLFPGYFILDFGADGGQSNLRDANSQINEYYS